VKQATPSPASRLNVPLGQGVGAVDPGRQSVPGGQTSPPTSIDMLLPLLPTGTVTLTAPPVGLGSAFPRAHQWPPSQPPEGFESANVPQNWPLSHCVHTALPVVLEKVPGRQATGAALPCGHEYPIGQLNTAPAAMRRPNESSAPPPL
jgi:hypothetical protein